MRVGVVTCGPQHVSGFHHHGGVVPGVRKSKALKTALNWFVRVGLRVGAMSVFVFLFVFESAIACLCVCPVRGKRVVCINACF